MESSWLSGYGTSGLGGTNLLLRNYGLHPLELALVCML